jgi:hypothetical protein
MMDSGPEVEKVYPVREFTDSPIRFPPNFRRFNEFRLMD